MSQLRQHYDALTGAGWAIGASALGMVVLIMVVIISAVMRGRVQPRPANVRDPVSVRVRFTANYQSM